MDDKSAAEDLWVFSIDGSGENILSSKQLSVNMLQQAGDDRDCIIHVGISGQAATVHEKGVSSEG